VDEVERELVIEVDAGAMDSRFEDAGVVVFELRKIGTVKEGMIKDTGAAGEGGSV
jgi:hypothetical protein